MIWVFVLLACLASILTGQLYIAAGAIVAGLLMGMGSKAHDKALESIPDDATMTEAKTRSGCGLMIAILFGLLAVIAFVVIVGVLSRIEGL